MPVGAPITAVLGPTNTGKTHRAVERMLEHDSAMIGLPLRLLAREVYDRLTTRVGEARVALVTGEEKRVPRRPDYWVCTVEAMPVDREVDFLAVDEIQLAAHDQRGHVFTDRLLNARGRRETWFLGADTMRRLVSELLPTATIAQHPRFSRLASAGPATLARLPSRSAVVAFGTPQVYELAERLRARRGGAAVVLGALSPRTRNAQVALFQSGEVDYLVATDAIGMGLNLDVSHVAFAGLRKFDGRAVRDLEPAELAQIAGRAGRHLNDGSFGTLTPLSLPSSVVQAIETHAFPSVRRLWWRSSALDLTSLDGLLGSLREAPRKHALRLQLEADDTSALLRLAEDLDVRARARGEEAVSLLWDICRIPDFRKLLLDVHVSLLREIFAQLTGPHGILATDWVAAHVAELDDPDGDIDTLLARIASIRTWTYVSQHARWLRDADAWQERTRAVEDRLSDALHERLVQRFVERGGPKRVVRSTPRARPRPAPSDRDTRDARLAPGAHHPFSALAALRGKLAGPAPAPPPLHDSVDAWVDAVVDAPHEELEVDAEGRILYGGEVLGALARGASPLLPEVHLVDLDGVGAGARSRILRRLVAYARDLATDLLAKLRTPASRELAPAARGVVYQIEQGLGTARARDAEAQLALLGDADRRQLQAIGVVLGARVLFVRELLAPAAVARRVALARAFTEGRAPARVPRGAVSWIPDAKTDPRGCALIGYPVFANRALRADVVERVFAATVAATSPESAPAAAVLAGWMGCPARDVPRVVGAIVRDEGA